MKQSAVSRHVLTYEEQEQFCEALFVFKPDLRAEEAVAIYRVLFQSEMVGSAIRRARDNMRAAPKKNGAALDREQWVRAYLTIFPEALATVVRRKVGVAFGTEMRQDLVDELRGRPLPRDEALAILRASPQYLREGAVRQPILLEGE